MSNVHPLRLGPSRRIAFLIAVCFVVALSVAACGPQDHAEEPQPAPAENNQSAPADNPSEESQPDQDSPPDTAPDASGSGAASTHPFADLEVQQAAPSGSRDELYAQLTFGGGGGGVEPDTICTRVVWDDVPASLPSLPPVFAANGHQRLTLDASIVVTEFLSGRFSEEPVNVIGSAWLPALCAQDESALIAAYAVTPDGTTVDVLRQPVAGLFDYKDGNWVEYGQIHGVTLPLEAHTMPGTWQLVTEYGGQTYTYTIELSASGDPFVVFDGDRYVAGRFAPNDRIKIVMAGYTADSQWTGVFDVQANANGYALYTNPPPDGVTFNSYPELISESGLVVSGGMLPYAKAILNTVAWQDMPVASDNSSPFLSHFRFCDQQCSLPGVTELEYSEEFTNEIWVAWDYVGMRQGMRYTREWYNDLDLWIHYDCVWQGPEQGTWETRLIDPDGGLKVGQWAIRIVVEDTHEFGAAIRLYGSNTFWDPVGTASTCPDF